MKKLTIILSLVLLIFSCKKDSSLQEENVDFNNKIKSKNKFSVFTDPPYTTSLRPKGLYLDDTFLNILGNTVKEDSLLLWAQTNSINKLSYYYLNTILASTTTKNQLASFIAKARLQGITDHVGILGTESHFTSIKNYNTNQSTNSKFNSIQLEDEWWQTGNTLTDYNNALSILKNMKTWGGSQSPKVNVELYFGRFNNIPGTDAQAADTLVKYTDRVLISNELNDPITNYYTYTVQGRVNEFKNAALRSNKTYPISIIYYPGQAPSYFASRTYETVFTNFTGRAWDEYVRTDDVIHGYQIYSYYWAKQLRPLPQNITFYVNNTNPSDPVNGQIRIYDETNSLIDMQTFAANAITNKALKQPSSWRMEIDATSTASGRYIMEIYMDGVFIDYFFIQANSTRTFMKVPYPSGYHQLKGNITLAFYPG